MRPRHVLQLSGLLLFMGCSPARPWFTCQPINLSCDLSGLGRPSGGPSDPTGEDTDEFFDPLNPGDDDDDSADGAGAYTAITLALGLSVESVLGDDDDSASPAPAGPVPAEGEYVISYWVDDQLNERLCYQTMRWEGDALLGAGNTPDCVECTTYVLISDAWDASDPTDPEQCAPDDIADDGDFGQQHLNVGDGLTRIAFVPSGALSGWVPEADLLDTLPATFSHYGFVHRDSGQLSGLVQVSSWPAQSPDWIALWLVGADDGDPTPDWLDGDYSAVGLFGLR